MATIQQKTTNGHKYWYIVESRRVNGKPRPIVLEYLGKADDLLKRLRGLTGAVRLRSYSHGLVAALLDVAVRLDVCGILNRYVSSGRDHTADKPVRNNLTAGASLMLAAIGRACTPTSKDGWSQWARMTSLEYMLRTNFSKTDSQHFWDTMDAFPAGCIEDAELTVLKKAMDLYDISLESLYYDTTNFYTYIGTANDRCGIAKRGKNKQKRNDLKQIGLALVVSKDGMIPLFHQSYEGNMNDSRVFSTVIRKVRDRLEALGADMGNHTIVFDRGNNSKDNIALVESMGMHYVGALTPYHHKGIISEACGSFGDVTVGGDVIQACRMSRKVWGRDMTVVVMISDKLKEGQIRGIYASLSKCDALLAGIDAALSNPRKIRRTKEQLGKLAGSIVSRYKVGGLVGFEILEDDGGCHGLKHHINYDKLAILEEEMGFRIVMSNRHDWDTAAIISAYHGQSYIENTFRNMKNRRHLSFNPQYHWTDQKIRVHNFCCVIGYLMTALIYKTAKEKGFAGSMDAMLSRLSNIRLGTIIESTGKQGRQKAVYMLEEMSAEDRKLMEDLGITDLHERAVKVNGFGVYT